MVIIDPGHGGFDPGGGSNSLFKERDMNLKISEYQKRRFDELGIPAVLVRSTDETLTPRQRTDRVRDLGATPNDILISNHINNGGSGGGEVIYSMRGTNKLPNQIAQGLQKAGVPIRNVYTRLGRSGNDFYFILRDTAPNNAMIIEYGFADNPSDTDRLVTQWPILAESVVGSIANYYQVPYTKKIPKYHMVEKGDSLYNISQKYNISIPKLKELNAISDDAVYPGTILILE